MGEREIQNTFQYTSIRSVYAGFNSFNPPPELKFWFSKEKVPYLTDQAIQIHLLGFGSVRFGWFGRVPGPLDSPNGGCDILIYIYIYIKKILFYINIEINFKKILFILILMILLNLKIIKLTINQLRQSRIL